MSIGNVHEISSCSNIRQKTIAYYILCYRLIKTGYYFVHVPNCFSIDRNRDRIVTA